MFWLDPVGVSGVVNSFIVNFGVSLIPIIVAISVSKPVACEQIKHI